MGKKTSGSDYAFLDMRRFFQLNQLWGDDPCESAEGVAILGFTGCFFSRPKFEDHRHILRVNNIAALSQKM